MHPGLEDFLFGHLRDRDRGEGYREMIYVDNVGLPTVGTGMMLPDEGEVGLFTWFAAGSGAPVPDSAVVQVWRPYRPVGPQAASPAGLEARRDLGNGATIIRQYRTNEASIHAVYRQKIGICESRAIEVMGQRYWDASPADAQFSILLHLWRAPNEFRGGWPVLRGALERRNWMVAAEQCTWHGMRWRRRDDLQLGFRNAAVIEQAHEERGVDKRILRFPEQYNAMTRDRWVEAPRSIVTY